MVDTLLAMLTRPGSPAPRVIDRHVREHRSLIHRHREIPVGPGKKGCSLRHSCNKIPQDVPCACTVEPKPCNCGNLRHYSGRCRCTPDQIARYRSKVSGPLLDRIEIRIEVPAVPPEELQRAAQGESSATVGAIEQDPTAYRTHTLRRYVPFLTMSCNCANALFFSNMREVV